MALVPTAYAIESVVDVLNGVVTTTSRTYNSGELVIVEYACATSGAGTNSFSISNSGTAQTWNLIADEVESGTEIAPVAAWYCVMSTTQAMTVTASFNSALSLPACVKVTVYTGQHSSDPVPAAKRYSGQGGADVTQSITPSAIGSCLRFWAADWNATNTFAAATNCTAIETLHDAGDYTVVAIRPTTDPRSDAAAFAIGETDTGGDVSWLAYEVQAAASAGGQFARPDADVSDGAWTPSTGVDLYACVDETPSSDTDFISVTSNSAAEIGLSNVSTPDVGTQTLRIRARGSPAKKLVAQLIEGTSTVRGTITVDPLTSTFTAYSTTSISGVTDYSNLKVKVETSAATSPPAATVTWGAAGTAASGTTSCTPSYPTGISASTSKIYCVVTGRSNTANTAPTMPAGWTKVADLEGGTGTWGVDAGTRRVTLFRKDTVTGSETGTVTVSLSGSTANTLRATIFRVEVPAGYGISEAASTGADTTNGTGYSATGTTNIDFAANDLLLIGVAQNIDSGTNSAQSITASGITFGTLTNQANTAVTNGNDHRHLLWSVPVSSGSGTVAPTFAYTISASGSGPTAFLRLRTTEPTEAGAISFIEYEVPAAGSGGPVNHSGAITESLSFTDSSTGSRTSTHDQAESFTLTDVGTGSRGSAHAQAESATLTDTSAATQGGIKTQTETLTFTDTSGAIQGFTGAQAENITLTDASSVSWAGTRTIAESITVSESSTASQGFTGASAESLTITDNPAAGTAISGSMAEAVTLTDASSPTHGSARSAAETLTLTDSSAAQAAFRGAMGEAVTVADAQTASAAFRSATTESLTVSDSTDGQTPGLGAMLESVTISESYSSQFSGTAQQQESASLTDSASASQGASRAQTESVTLTDSASAVIGRFVAVSELLSLSDAQSASKTLSAAVAESFSVNDVASSTAAAIVAMAESLSLVDLTDSLKSYLGAIAESVILADVAAANQIVGGVNLMGERTMFVPAENRQFSVVAESRALSPNPELRQFVVTAEARLYSIDGENRALQITAELRVLNITK
jgi:hypothetical protein